MGTWSLIVLLIISSTASLEKYCPSNILKKFLSDSDKAKEHYQNGETISVTCLADAGDVGYVYANYEDNDGSDTKDNSVVLNCTEGKWIGHYPECFTNCSKPDIYATLDPEYDLYSPGDNVTIRKCKKDNARIEGDTTLICMADGTWIGSARCPEKQRSCNEQPPTIANAYIAAQVLDEYIHGTVLRYKCGQAFDQTGRHSVTCQDGQWVQDSVNRMLCNIGQCSSIYDREIENGRVKNILGVVGTYAEFECYDGYELEGSARILCMADRNWYPEIPRCKPVSCPSPKQVQHGSMVQEAYNGVLNIYQSTIRYDCDKGYRLVGSQFRKCQADRTWSGSDTICEEITCAKPSAPENGNVYLTDNSEKVGSQIEYICDAHHKMEPVTSQFAICTEYGYWSTPEPRCIKQCLIDPPDNVEYLIGARRVVDTYIDHGTVMQARCPARMELVISDEYLNKNHISVRCHLGTLEPQSVGCKYKRCNIPHVENGYFKNNEFEIRLGERIHSSSNITLICAKGYELYNQKMYMYLELEHTDVQCLHGSFTAEIPKCKPKRCNVKNVENGQFYQNFNIVPTGETIGSGTTVILKCNDRYDLYDESTSKYVSSQQTEILCSRGSFDRNAVFCKPKRCKMPTGRGLLPKIQSYSETGDSYTLRCQDKMELFLTGNYLDADNILVSCDKGKWIPDLPQCVNKRCNLPKIDNGHVRNGTMILHPGEKIGSEEKVILECFEGFELHYGIYINSNWTYIECSEGSFIEDIPLCKDKRCQLDRSSNLLPQISFTESGFSLNISCPNNMELISTGLYEYREAEENKHNLYVSCRNGRWTPALPHCQLKRCNLPKIDNGHVRNGTMILHPGEKIGSEEKVLLECFEGFELHNGTYMNSNWTYIECREGSFIEDIPLCKDKRCQLDRSSKLLPQINFTESGFSLNVSCPAKMELIGTGLYEYREAEENRESFNKHNLYVSCRNGRWTPALPHCQWKMCKPPVLTQVITGFMVNGTETKPEELFPHDQSIKAVCREGYRQQGTLTCNSGIWKGNSTCELEVCNEPDFQYIVVKNGTLVNEDIIFSHGTKLNAFCDSSSTLNNDTGRTRNGTSTECIHGEWKPKLSCKKTCTLPTGRFTFGNPKFQNITKKEGDRIRDGMKMVPICPSGHKKVTTSICSNGTWVPSFEECTEDIGRCSLPNDHGMQFTHIRNSTIVTDGQLQEGDKVVVSCKFGYEIYESGNEYDYLDAESTAYPVVVPEAEDSEKLRSVNDGTYTCIESGKWEPEIRLTCKQIICLGLDVYGFENGRISYSSPNIYKVGTVASFICNPGYTRDGPANRTCQEDGTWSDTCVTCQKDNRNLLATCPAPCVPDWAIKTGSYTYDLGSRVEFQCFPSKMQYSGDSSNIRHCVKGNISAVWNGTLINCKGLRDISLQMIAEGIADGWGNLSRALGIQNSQDIATADEHSRNALKILQHWRDVVMRDKPKSLIPNLIIVMETLQERDIAVALRSLNGLEKIRCNYPLLNGTVNPDQSVYLFGQSVRVSSCDDGYMLVNQSYLVCTEQGNWTGNSTCRHAICSPECGINGKCARDNECQCSEGFSGKTCDEKVKSEVECEPLADDYKVIQTGVVQGKFSDQTVVEIICNKSTAPFDDVYNATCNKSNWHPWKPFCENTCSLQSIPGTLYNYNISRDRVLAGPVSSGRRIKVTCERGYIPVPQLLDVSMCINGVWEPDISRCEKEVSCAKPSLLNVIVHPLKEKYAVNENVSLIGCLKGLDLVGVRSLQCLKDGSWFGLAQCTLYCKNGKIYWSLTPYKRVDETWITHISYKVHPTYNQCYASCAKDQMCKALSIYKYSRNSYYCKLYTENTRNMPRAFVTEGHKDEQIYDKACNESAGQDGSVN